MLFTRLLDYVEKLVRTQVEFICNYLPVKVIRDDRGVPFLYRYHLFSLTKDGPGMCIHRFVKSDPDRGYHDHPWHRSMSLILCGGYEERIFQGQGRFSTHKYTRFHFNYLNGEKFHRVMLDKGCDAWTLFAFWKRSKTWGMIGLDGQYHAMSTAVSDQDGGWWQHVMRGIGLHTHLEHSGNVIAMVDCVIITERRKVLLIKRGKTPYLGCWAFVGGRVEQKDLDLEAAAYRELKEETGLTPDKVCLVDWRTIGNNYRDARGFCITTIYIGLLNSLPQGIRAGDDAVDYRWFDLDDLPEMAFDHREILEKIKRIVAGDD
jgi:ADP-ribose pyrophosphatase YjhB (NUDIX family)